MKENKVFFVKNLSFCENLDRNILKSPKNLMKQKNNTENFNANKNTTISYDLIKISEENAGGDKYHQKKFENFKYNKNILKINKQYEKEFNPSIKFYKKKEENFKNISRTPINSNANTKDFFIKLYSCGIS